MHLVKLKDLVDIYLGVTHTPEYISSGVPFLSVKDISGGSIVFDNCKYISEFEYESLPNGAKPKEGDLLFCRVGTIGKPILIPEGTRKFGSFVSLGFLRNKDSEKCDLNYLKYWMNSENFYNQVKSNVKGASQVNLNTGWLSKFDVPLLPLKAQKEIVEKFDTIQCVVALRKHQLAKLDELVKARFVEMFGDCKNEVHIGDVISISRGASPRPISAFITDSDDGVNWIKIGDVSENSLYITKTEERITLEGAKKSRMVHKGDFILSNSMSFGRPYILGINGCVHDGWLIMSDFKDTFNELYLYHAIRSDDVQYQFSGKVNGATVKNLNSDLVKNTFIKFPPMDEQNQFAVFVEQVNKSKAAVQKALDEAQTLFDSLMQQYFG